MNLIGTSSLRLLASFVTFACATASEIYQIPSALSNAPSHAQFTSGITGLDAPKVHPINASAFDWWYFDIVSTDPSSFASAVVVFYTASSTAIPSQAPSNMTLPVQIWLTFPNGTQIFAQTQADAATVTAEGDFSSGDWHGSGFAWRHAPNSGSYEILINAPDSQIKGSINFQPRAPAHYPCGPAQGGQNMEVGPQIGWANALPDAASTVDLIVSGTKLFFSGAGYHDKNWSDQPLVSNVASWYWGHCRIGPYSIVWFDFLALNGTEYVSAYASKDDSILVASCEPGSIRVRPTGQDSTYPPHISTGDPSGYHITLDLGIESSLELNVSVEVQIAAIPPIYTRSKGRVTGVLTTVGTAVEEMAGVALFEQLVLTE
ncbi:hypothetical protein MVEN_00319300 [Mycena venus]|uniref:Hydroxyneurosporene synthase n=1 Tax=Mycena venus TaxID=2733690 RepID=A0A8H6YUE5_9AGAR|nr:hypothetical protein MVEN_00319300 [Mycena venus]